MALFEFVSHEYFPEDQYTKEVVVLCLEGKYRVSFLRKSLKNGSMFWSVVSASVSKNGEKSFVQGFEADSSFLNKDIMNFLNARSWESNSVFKPKSMKEANQDELPF